MTTGFFLVLAYQHVVRVIAVSFSETLELFGACLLCSITAFSSLTRSRVQTEPRSSCQGVMLITEVFRAADFLSAAKTTRSQ